MMSTPTCDMVLIDFSPVLRRFAWRRLGDWDAAEDATQETLSRTLAALRTGRVEKPESLPGFLLKTAQHVCCHRIRSWQRERRALARLDRSDVDRSAESVVRRLIDDQRMTALRVEIERLSPEDRRLIEQICAGEAASSVRSSSTMRVRKHRLLRMLRGRLMSREDSPVGQPTQHRLSFTDFGGGDSINDLHAFYKRDKGNKVSGGVRRITGRDPIKFDQFAKDHAKQFRS